MFDRICEMWRAMRSITAMVMVQIATAGLNILFKLAMEDGMNPSVLVAYRLLFATIFMLPLSFIFQRKRKPEFTWRLMLLALLSGLLGVVIPSILTIAGLAQTSATFTSAAGVLTPLITFIIAALLRMESVRVGSSVGLAKVFGTLLGVGGALVFIFYRGKEIHLWSTHVNLVKIGKIFGGAYWNATLMNMMGSIVAMLVAFCWKHDLNEWRLGWNIRLLTVAYAAIVISGMAVAVNAWCVESRGPLFVSVFSPVGLVIVALVGSFLLDETLHLGSIIGTVIIVGGLYLVLWGKNKEMKSVLTVTSSDHIETNKTSKDITLNNLPTLSRNVP
ncbi:PREDICTED: WAT1-related protein At1g68170-like isoform X3 [Camelina sativa]|uniref:WAT1-related protein n=1 Tax=Camelina sativa TaxID=90675 RepID=A0ABM0Z874_CAMSA|nr:PREDICTED: WAT1-related protein At1g68170-like isoform X3 [Camelina sativa]